MDGLYPECKECSKKKADKWAKDNPEKQKENRLRIWSKQERKEKVRRYNKKHRDSDLKKKWDEENKDKLREYNKKRSLKNHKISSAEWLACKEYFDNSCAYCGLSADSHFINIKGELKLFDLHREHVDDEGANDLSNCIPSCRFCNSCKHTSSLYEWYTEGNPVYDENKLHKINQWLNEDYKKYQEK